MLEFGVSSGGTFELLLHFRDVWLRKLRLHNRVVALGYDTFEGLPVARSDDTAPAWKGGDYASDLESLDRHLTGKFAHFELAKGLFSDTLAPSLDRLRANPPVFVAIDCDYYSSTIDVFDRLLPDVAPHGCMLYFDDVSAHLGSDRAGELQAIREVNEGRYGAHIQLAEYPLWIETGELRHYRQSYRLINLEKLEQSEAETRDRRQVAAAPGRGRLSPL
jgi:hypothetical protein